MNKVILRGLQFAIVLIALIACDSSSKETDSYYLVYVQDGDSVVLCCEIGNKFTVRLLDIDAPERYQPYAENSKQQLHDLLDKKSLTLLGAKFDKYGRRLAVIEVNGININARMVETGAAWVWRFSKNRGLKKLQEEAREQKRGLWSLPESEIQDPWLWRQSHSRK
ncbi:thermonuclease family protein [Kangiella sediminilitoris]|uniref:TNase-like domain-containing protein n=1 Tax=Kangiella sediminilitoris TaxID=1144748 RepID=A0A1B3BDK6_9GAMM|nr:thermonuclease family protein [Kangiella sediminilitoris]AOE50896.1 hypothetical protein KS2013_2191 [Kangiella sediminilitoris]